MKFLYGFLLVMVGVAFVSCTDDDDDTEAPRLKVTPTTLVFNDQGQAVEGSQSFFSIETNRSWRIIVPSEKTWLTLSKTEGYGNADIQVSIPANTNDEASITVELYNKVGPLSLTETVRIKAGGTVTSEVIYNETAGNKAVTSPPTYVDQYDGWNTTGIGSASVTYGGQNATIRSSGKASAGYEGASGPNVVFFGTLPANFQVKNITLTDAQKDLKLTFGASYSKKVGTEYINTFDTDSLIVSLSSDGTNWTPITYTKNNGDQTDPYWIFATSNFSIKNAVQSLYIQFTAKAASAIRVDDITLSTGAGGTEIDLIGGDTPSGDAKIITIPQLNALMTSDNVIDATADRYFEAVVQNDVAGNNYSFLATENSSTAGNGITLYGSQVEPTTLGLNKGDKVKVTLIKGLAQTKNYNGMHEVTGGKTDTWVKVEKLGSTATITPTVITIDKLADYQGMAVTINNATTTTAGIWANKLS